MSEIIFCFCLRTQYYTCLIRHSGCRHRLYSVSVFSISFPPRSTARSTCTPSRERISIGFPGVIAAFLARLCSVFISFSSPCSFLGFCCSSALRLCSRSALSALSDRCLRLHFRLRFGILLFTRALCTGPHLNLIGLGSGCSAFAGCSS